MPMSDERCRNRAEADAPEPWQAICCLCLREVLSMSCSHSGCHCNDATLERDGKVFCSERCADAARRPAAPPGCPCGHPDCAAV